MDLTKLQRSEYRLKMEELLLNIHKNQKGIKRNMVDAPPLIPEEFPIINTVYGPSSFG